MLPYVASSSIYPEYSVVIGSSPKISGVACAISMSPEGSYPNTFENDPRAVRAVVQSFSAFAQSIKTIIELKSLATVCILYVPASVAVPSYDTILLSESTTK